MFSEEHGTSATANSSQEQQITHSDGPTTPSFDAPSATSTPSSGLITRLELLSTRVPDFYIAPFCGASAGVASGIVTCPLDVIKTKLQAQGGFVRRGGQVVEAKALYRDSWWLARGYASITAGACSTIVTNPIWVIKTRLMSQSLRSDSEGFRAPWRYSGTWDAARKMYKTEGIRSFYAGLTPALLGLTHVAIQFPLYEYLKMAFTGYGIGEHPDHGTSHWIGISLATFLSKICASTVTYPHEVLRTRLQTQQRTSPVSSPEEIAFRGGVDHPECRGRPPTAASSDGMPNRPRYTGVVRTNLFRAVPAAMTTMLTYEYLRKTISHLQHEGALKQQMAEAAKDSSGI
ncbi:hypothetical protein APSETT444_000736 [Aspergillus pseudonomiae]